MLIISQTTELECNRIAKLQQTTILNQVFTFMRNVTHFHVTHFFIDFCSHHMSWKYFADSVINPAYLAVKCLRKNKYCTKQDIVIVTFPYCNCERYGTDVAYMGWNVNTR